MCGSGLTFEPLLLLGPFIRVVTDKPIVELVSECRTCPRLPRERQRAAAAGSLYGSQQAGHVPDTTWRGIPRPHSWLPLDPVVNKSLGVQVERYSIGYKPWIFLYGTQ